MTVMIEGPVSFALTTAGVAANAVAAAAKSPIAVITPIPAMDKIFLGMFFIIILCCA
jgi:hypothetical protein